MDPSQWNSQDLCGGPEGWAPEESLDVEMAHGLAPDANVVYVGANSCTDDDLLGAISNIVDNHLADVISNSWGEIMHTTDNADITATEISAYEQVFKQAAVEGIGINFSAGDCGDSSPFAAATGANCQADTSRAQANWPDSDPWVTSVGGTALGLDSKSGSYGFETDMGTQRSALSADGTSWTPLPGNFYFGGGGGTSEDFAQPWYQRGTVPNSLSHTLMTGAKSTTRAARHARRLHERRPVHLGPGRHVRRRRVQRGGLRRHQRVLPGVRRGPGRQDAGPAPLGRLRQPADLRRLARSSRTSWTGRPSTAPPR